MKIIAVLLVAIVAMINSMPADVKEKLDRTELELLDLLTQDIDLRQDEAQEAAEEVEAREQHSDLMEALMSLKAARRSNGMAMKARAEQTPCSQNTPGIKTPECDGNTPRRPKYFT